MLRFFSVLSLMFGDAFTQINPIRDPALTVVPTIGPIINTIGPIRTIGTIGTIGTVNPGTVVINRTSTTSTTSTESTITSSINSNNTDTSGDNLTLVYALVPTGIIALLLLLFCLRRKRDINNNNVVNIDLNIENVIPPDNFVNKQSSVNSDRFSNHIYEEVDYEARYEMPTIGRTGTTKYENVFNGDQGKNNEYGKQVTTII